MIKNILAVSSEFFHISTPFGWVSRAGYYLSRKTFGKEKTLLPYSRLSNIIIK